MKVFNTALLLVVIAAVAVAESNGLRGAADERSLQLLDGFSLDGIRAFFERLLAGLGGFCAVLGICDSLPPILLPACDTIDELPVCLQRTDCGVDFVIGGLTIASVPPEITDLASANINPVVLATPQGQAFNDFAQNIFKCVDA